jgi:LuxR family maltose regulon positive regulatory protein
MLAGGGWRQYRRVVTRMTTQGDEATADDARSGRYYSRHGAHRRMATRPRTRIVSSLPRLSPPRRRQDTIRRTRLHRALSDALESDVIVISAPAGYGKSTLAVDWLAELALPHAWLSLDRQDRDPHALVADLAAAVRTAFPDALDDFAERLEQAAGSEALALAGELAAAVQAEVDELFLLVIDECDALEGATDAIQVLDELVRAVPLNTRLCLLARNWTLIPSLARLTAQRRAFSLAARDLQFTDEEAVEFLRRAGIEESAEQSGLMRRADGWAAALAILAEHHEPGGPAAGEASEFILADFIEQEVLSRLPVESVALLEACAVLQSFDVPLAREVSGSADAPRRLRDLERSTHLIVRLQALTTADAGQAMRTPRRTEPDWYRTHAILREHLLGRLEREDPERLRNLRRTAAALYARRGMRREAVEMALDAGDWIEAVEEIRELRDELYQRGEWATLAGWLDRLPGEILESDPDLVMTRARQSIKVLDGQGGLIRLDALDEGRLTGEQRVRRELYRSVALRHLNRLPDALEACRRARSIALEALPEGQAMFAEIDLEEAVALAHSGSFAAARRRFAAAAEQFERLGDHHRAAEGHEGLGATLYYEGWLAESMREFTSAQRLWRVLDDQHQQLSTMNNIGNVQHMLGELETARDTFNALVQRSRDRRNRRMEAYGHLGLADVERDLAQLETAASLYALAIEGAQEADDAAALATATFGLAMAYRERGDHSRARTLLEHGLRTAEQAGAVLRQARFRLGLGATLLSEHRFAEAVPVLQEAVQQTAETGARREEAVARLSLAAACYHRRQRSHAAEELERVAALAAALGYDQFLHAEARQMVEVVEYGAARGAAAAYFKGLRERLRPAVAPAPASGAPVQVEAVPRIRAEAFGTPRVFMAGRQVSDLEWRSERSKEMFFFLLHVQRPVRKEQIALELWPELSQQQINSAFHSTLYRLRRALDRQVVVQTDGGYQVNDEFGIEYDAREFEEHMQAAERADRGSSEWVEHLSTAVALYRGPFAEPYESEWADDQRRRYEDRYLSSLTVLAADALKRGDYDEALRLTESVLELDALNETAVSCQMQAHARAGYLDRAARAYRRHHDAVRDELGQEPSRAVQALYQRVLSGAALQA